MKNNVLLHHCTLSNVLKHIINEKMRLFANLKATFEITVRNLYNRFTTSKTIQII